jgi:large subunit ribosomal protein L46
MSQVYFMPALYLAGDVKVDGKEIVDYAWVTVDEMQEYLSPDLYAKAKLFLPQ